jgi:catalase-peroxidase
MTDNKTAELEDLNAPEARGCPITGGDGRTNRDWWPEQFDLKVLHPNPPAGDPMGENFDYAAEFESLDLDAVKRDIEESRRS